MNKNRCITVLLCVIGCLHTFCLSAQKWAEKPVSNQISFTWDNDYFLFTGTDRYYTNGLFIKYDKAMKTASPGVLKKTFSIEAGQMIYKQFTRKVWPTVLVSNYYPGGLEAIDRPITGYLYGKYSQQVFYKKQQMLQWGASVGTIGPMSQGKQVQTGWHKEAGVGYWWDWVWDFQLRSEIGGNLHGKYVKSFIKKPGALQISSVTSATLGTTFTDASQSLMFRLGRLNEMHESDYWNSRISNNAKGGKYKNEFYFYFSPEIKYQAYNATIQGGIFLHDKGPITKDIKPFFFTNKAGIQYASRKNTFGLSAVFLTKEVKGQFTNHAYGSIHLARRF